MGRRDVTIYDCDGCGASAKTPRGDAPTGFHRIVFVGKPDVWLCTVCYGAVEWVTRFQGITRPPKVYKNGSGYGLRKGMP